VARFVKRRVTRPREISGSGVVGLVNTSQKADADPLPPLGEDVEVVEKRFPWAVIKIK
jgi:hypothetical protein